METTGVVILEVQRGRAVEHWHGGDHGFFTSHEEAIAAVSVMHGWTFMIVPAVRVVVPHREAK